MSCGRTAHSTFSHRTVPMPRAGRDRSATMGSAIARSRSSGFPPSSESHSRDRPVVRARWWTGREAYRASLPVVAPWLPFAMIVGHLGLAYAARARWRQIPFAWLIVATMAPDLARLALDA